MEPWHQFRQGSKVHREWSLSQWTHVDQYQHLLYNISSTVAQYWKWGMSFALRWHQFSNSGRSSASSKSVIQWRVCARLCSMCSVVAVIWWALLVRVTWAARRKESAVPGVAISACTNACTQPLPRSQSPSVFRAAISMWSPPNITTILSSHTSLSPNT